MGCFDISHFAQDDSVVKVMSTIYNVISTGVTRNGEIPTVWIIVRDLSALGEMTK